MESEKAVVRTVKKWATPALYATGGCVVPPVGTLRVRREQGGGDTAELGLRLVDPVEAKVRVRAPMWSKDEIEALRSAAEGLRNPRTGFVHWPKLVEQMGTLSFPLRTRVAYQQRYWALRRKPSETSEERPSGEGKAGGTEKPLAQGEAEKEKEKEKEKENAEAEEPETADAPPTESLTDERREGGERKSPKNEKRPQENGEENRDSFRRLAFSWLKKTKGKPLEEWLPIRKFLCNRELLQYSDDFIKYHQSQMYKGRLSLRELTRAVYAVAKTCEQRVQEVKSEGRLVRNGEIGRVTEAVRAAQKNLGWIQNELDRRRIKAQRSCRRKVDEKLDRLRELCGGVTLAKLLASKVKIVQELRYSQDLLRQMTTDQTRQRTRLAYEKEGMKGAKRVSRENGRERNCARSSKEAEEKTFEFWKDLYAEDSEFKPNPVMRDFVRSALRQQSNVPIETLTVERISKYVDEVITKVKPWKAAGIDRIQGYWWKNLPTAKDRLKRIIIELMTGQLSAPAWWPRGRTFLIAKTAEPSEKDYRPITCLNISYKILTGAIARHLSNKYATNPILFPAEQKALRKGEQGCVEAHLIDSSIIKDCLLRKRSKRACLTVAWVDFAKAFDSIGHKYLLWMLEQIKMEESVVGLMKGVMANWVTRLELNGKLLGDIPIKQGVYQGDALSPLLFSLAIAPISFEINSMIEGYACAAGNDTTPMAGTTHLYYMDDLKVFAKDGSEVSMVLEAVKDIGGLIGLKINPSKSAKLTIRSGSEETRSCENINDVPVVIDKAYKYLGVQQYAKTATREVQQETVTKVKEAVSDILAISDLAAGQVIREINRSVLPKVEYLFCNAEIGAQGCEVIAHVRRLDQAIRQQLNNAKFRYAHSLVDRWYVRVKEGGFGLRSCEETYVAARLDAYLYLQMSAGLSPFREVHRTYQKRGKRTLRSEAEWLINEYLPGKIEIGDDRCHVNGTLLLDRGLARKAIRKAVKDCFQERHLLKFNGSECGKWKAVEAVDVTKSSLWLRELSTSGKNLRIIMGAQEGNIFTASGIPPRNCSACGDVTLETVAHVTTMCPAYRTTRMVQRHNDVVKRVHEAFSKKLGLPKNNYHKTPLPEVSGPMGKIWYDQLLKTTVPIRHRQPDLVVFEKSQGILEQIVVVEIQVSGPQKIEQSRRHKIDRYSVNGNCEETLNQLVTCKPGLNIVSDLQKQYKVPVRLWVVNIGVCGEVPRWLIKETREILKISLKESERLVGRISLSAALGTAGLLKEHLHRAGVNDLR